MVVGASGKFQLYPEYPVKGKGRQEGYPEYAEVDKDFVKGDGFPKPNKPITSNGHITLNFHFYF